MATSPDLPRAEEMPLLLAPAALHELYVWLESRAMGIAGEGVPGRVHPMYVTSPEISTLQRCSEALLWFFAGQSEYFVEHAFIDLLDRLRPTEAAAAMYSAYLEHHFEAWRACARSAHRYDDEPKLRTRILRRVRVRFYGALGVLPADVAQRARRLALDTHPCSGRYLTWHRDGTVEVKEPIVGPRPDFSGAL